MCWWIGTPALVASLAAAVVVVLPYPGHDEALGFVTVVIGAWIPTTGSVFLIALALAIALFVVARALAPTPTRPIPVQAFRTTLLVLLFVATVPAGALVALSGSSYQMLPGASAGGCRIVVHEYAFLYAAWGDVGIVQPDSATVRWEEDYLADDGYEPFTSGTYRLDWDGPSARLAVWGVEKNSASWLSGEPSDLVCDR